ncbi:hypothetical protein Poly21_20890 [Allorhodopirellula heiligendammensis]|uniref:Uncharacterized protein n=1 Tax=Allorhodopirellula heiligendammensis TaxID=2714739 RepID=A0A5C6C5K3_9BACT|nr:hypothetical protein Poly21_20890 [Allorhodopirellula heiligendammensis]
MIHLWDRSDSLTAANPLSIVGRQVVSNPRPVARWPAAGKAMNRYRGAVDAVIIHYDRDAPTGSVTGSNSVGHERAEPGR